MDNKRYKLIFNPYLARELLVKYGHKIIDLKKDSKRKNAVVFVFEVNSEFFKDLTKATSEMR